MIKAIFFDIDGTLLSYRTHVVLPGTIEAFRQLRQKGVLTFISSGRPMVLIPQLPVDFDGYITVNGGYCTVCDPTKGTENGHDPSARQFEVLLRNPIPVDDCRRWFHYVEQNNLVTMCFTEYGMFINRIDEDVVRLQNQMGFTMPPVKALDEFSLQDGSDVYQFIAMQPPADDEKVLALLPHCRMPRWHPAFSDLIPVGSSKAVGIKCILNHFGIKREEAMAFGDGANDIEMLEYVGTGVAMGNAAEIVKQHADYVTDDADSEGILHALQRLNVIV